MEGPAFNDLPSLYDTYGRRVYQLALRLCRSRPEAEDLTHDVFLRYRQSNRKAIIDLAKAFNLSLVGEGVETSAQMSALQSLGCDDAQGYLFKDKAKFSNPAS